MRNEYLEIHPYYEGLADVEIKLIISKVREITNLLNRILWSSKIEKKVIQHYDRKNPLVRI